MQKKYTVLAYFEDLQDDRHAYQVGSTYPRKGYTPTYERIKELLGSNNKQKKPLIEQKKSDTDYESDVEIYED